MTDHYTGDLFDSGKDRRDRGVRRVSENESDKWWTVAHASLVIYARDHPNGFLTENFRQFWLASGQPEPHHPNVWGALTLSLAREGLIRNTGVYQQAKSLKNHAHRYAVWEYMGR